MAGSGRKPKLGDYTKSVFEKRGIEVLLRTGVREATGTAIVTTGGEVIDTRTVVATIGNAPSPMVAKLDLPNERGRIRTDRTLRVEGRDGIRALGDAALIPLVDAPSERSHYAPPTAQFAVREARTLARNIAAALEGRPGEPFVYKSKGALASLGAHRGVAEVYGVRLAGLPAWLLWRGYYLSFVPGFATKMRVAAQWLLDSMVGRSTVQTGVRQGPGTRYVRYRAGDRVFEEGNRADGFYAVLEGAFDLKVRDAAGRETVRRIGFGGHFGERVLLGEGLRTGTVRGSGAGPGAWRCGCRRTAAGPRDRARDLIALAVAFAVERARGEQVADRGHELTVRHRPERTRAARCARRGSMTVDGGAGHPPEPAHHGDAIGVVGGGRDHTAHRLDLRRAKGRCVSRRSILVSSSSFAMVSSPTLALRRPISASRPSAGRLLRAASPPEVRPSMPWTPGSGSRGPRGRK
jgi:hypothetical protein